MNTHRILNYFQPRYDSERIEAGDHVENREGRIGLVLDEPYPDDDYPLDDAYLEIKWLDTEEVDDMVSIHDVCLTS